MWAFDYATLIFTGMWYLDVFGIKGQVIPPHLDGIIATYRRRPCRILPLNSTAECNGMLRWLVVWNMNFTTSHIMWLKQ